MDTPKLTDVYIRKLSLPGKYADGTVNGLYLHIIVGKTKTAKHWRMKYYLEGKEKLASFGSYPAVSLLEAREAAQAARKGLRLGVSPVKARASQNAAGAAKAMTFKDAAALFLDFKKTRENPPLGAKTLSGYEGALKNWAYPVLGDMALADIELSHVVKMETAAGTTSMAKASRDLVSAVLGYACGEGMIKTNVCTFGKRRIKHKSKRRAALTKPEDVAEYLRRLEAYNGRWPEVKEALRLLVLLPCRPAELVSMQWADIDLDTAAWRYFVSKTARHSVEPERHFVPLPEQAVVILRRLAESRKGQWVFPSRLAGSTKHRGRDSLLAAMTDTKDGLGYERGTISAHGFRRTFRTLAEEQGFGDTVTLELALSHTMPGSMGDTYAGAKLEAKRRELAQQWADYVFGLKA